MTGKKKTLSPYYVVTVIILAFLAVFFLFPLYWIVTGSVKEKSDIIIKSGEIDVYKRQEEFVPWGYRVVCLFISFLIVS